MKKYILVSVLAIGCRTTHLMRTPNNYNITKGKKFAFENKFNLPDTSLLSTSKIYLCSCNGGGSSWFEFYENGKVIHATTIKHNPGIIDTFSLCGYYILSDNDIAIEMSHGVSNGMLTGDEWGIVTIKGKIIQDTLKIFSDKWNGKGRNLKEYTDLKKANGEKCFYMKSGKNYKPLPLDW